MSLLQTAALVACVFTAAGFVKGVVGLGLPTLSMGCLSLAMPPSQAAALLVVPSLVSNVWQVGRGPGLGALVRRLAGLLVGACVGTAIGVAVFGGLGAAWASPALGVALVAYAALALSPLPLRVAPRHERWASPAVGVVTGVVTAVTGVFVMPAVPYLQALGLDRDALVRALGLAFFVSTVALAVALQRRGALDAHSALASTAAVLPVLVGMHCGQRVRERVSPATFKRLFLFSLAALGLALAVRVP